MIYTSLTKKAMKIAFEAHKNQVDKSGVPYIYHPIHLAEQMTDELTTIVALLHDVVEDSDITFDLLISEGFPNEAIEALVLLTHTEDIPYLEYVQAIKTNKVATIVKLADLKHNSDLTRLDNNIKAKERVKKYSKAIGILEK